jgi:hypothetical protein
LKVKGQFPYWTKYATNAYLANSFQSLSLELSKRNTFSKLYHSAGGSPCANSRERPQKPNRNSRESNLAQGSNGSPRESFLTIYRLAIAASTGHLDKQTPVYEGQWVYRSL